MRGRFSRPLVVLFFVVSASTIVPTARSGGLGISGAGRVIITILSATACTKELGTKIVMVHISGAVGGVRITERRIAV